MSRKWSKEQKAAARLKALERWERKKSLDKRVEGSVESEERANTHSPDQSEPTPVTLLSPIQLQWKTKDLLQYRYDRGNGNWSNWIDVPYE